MEADIKHLNELLSICFKDKVAVFSFNSTESYPLSFKIETPESIGIFSIEKGDYLEGSLSELEIDSSFRFYISCRDAIIEAWNKHRSTNEASISQRRYRIKLCFGVLSKVTITNHEKSEYYELNYGYSPETKLYSIKGLIGVNLPDKNKHMKIVFKMIFELEDFHGTINEKISKMIIRKLKHSFLSAFLVNSKLTKNESIKNEILVRMLKLKPVINHQENFDQATIDSIKKQNSFWFSQYHTIRLGSSIR